MCMFSAPTPPQDNSAQIAQQQEQQRQANIAAGRTNIDNAFSQFDDPYYSGVTKNYDDFYFPQAEEQYNNARKSLVLKLSGSGNLNAGTGAQQLGDLDTAYLRDRAQIGQQGVDAANQQRSNIEAAREDLYNQNQTAADPSSASSLAAARSQALLAPQPLSPLGDLFSTFLNQGATATAAQTAGYPGWGIPIPAVFNTNPTQGSGSVVN
jgi:hypothetical protein